MPKVAILEYIHPSGINLLKKNSAFDFEIIEIISKEKMRKLKPDYLFVLIWSFRREVIKQEKEYIKKGGKLIFHLPMFHIVDKDNYRNYLKSDFKPFAYQI